MTGPIQVTVKLGSIPELKATFASMRSLPDATAKRIHKLWAERYEGFTRTRFVRYSRGGGDWPPLAASTVKGRRPADRRNKGKTPKGLTKARVGKGSNKLVATGRSYAILRDTGLLFNALTIGGPGNVVRQIPGGFIFGIEGGSHGKRTVGQIAAYHQTGNKRLPRRRILVKPDQNTITGMQADAAEILRQVTRQR